MSLENPIKSHEVLRFFGLIVQYFLQSTLIYNCLNPMPNPMVCVCMVSTFSRVGYASTGYSYQSCSWSAEEGKVKLNFAFILYDRFLTDQRKPSYASAVTFYEATAPVELPA